MLYDSGRADRDRTDDLMSAIQMGRLPGLFFKYLKLRNITIHPDTFFTGVYLIHNVKKNHPYAWSFIMGFEGRRVVDKTVCSKIPMCFNYEIKHYVENHYVLLHNR